MRRKCLCAALAVSCVINVSLAQVRLQGKVVDESNEPIPGANIRVSESLNGTTTDAGGKFELNLPDGNHRIRVTYLGYEQGVYQTDHSEKDVVIKLKEKYVNIDQVVVTGTGSHRRMSNSPIPVKVLTGQDLKDDQAVSEYRIYGKRTGGYDEYERIDGEIRGYLGKR